jgi:magnesium-transporting ATPase (P-type)
VFALSLAAMLSIGYILAFADVAPIFGASAQALSPNLGASVNSVALEQAEARTVLLSVAIIAQSALILSLRRLNKPMYKSLREDKNWKIWPLVVLIPIFHVMLMYIPQMQYALSQIGIRFELTQLEPLDWLLVLALGLTPIALLELTKIIWNRKDKLKASTQQQIRI